jgi:D-alanyl-D-alanine carboxypeptidase/D-alanyl-D-alanine-endopeptidase (penicillin-binding protein 4)
VRRLPVDHPVRRAARGARPYLRRGRAYGGVARERLLRGAAGGARQVRTASARAWTAVRSAERPELSRERLLTWAALAARRYAAVPARRVVVAATGTGLVLALLAVLATGPWQGGQRGAERALAAAAHGVRPGGHPVAPRPVAAAPQWHPAQEVLAPAGQPAADPAATGLAAALAPLLKSAGGRVTAAVADPATGRLLLSVGGDRPQPPASTNKLLTATAALALLGPEHRIRTTVVTSGGRLVLVGGGDPTLTTSDNPAGNSLAALARQTATALRAAGTTGVRLAYDTSLFTGPDRHPIGRNDNIALVQPLLADEGRIDPSSTEDAPRYDDPAAASAVSFARLLAKDGIAVQGAPQQATAAPGAPVLAAVQSGPLAGIVERMLTESDNDIAESLNRLTAIAAGQPASFAGGAAAVRQTLTRLGLDLTGVQLRDGSGLDEDDAIPAAVLTRVLALDASPAHPELRAVLSGLPVAGFTGTLDDRFDGTGGAGVVHAKTGSLTGVDTLAGTVVDRDGRLLVFAFMSHGTGALGSARALLDALAGHLAACGCG